MRKEPFVVMKDHSCKVIDRKWNIALRLIEINAFIDLLMCLIREREIKCCTSSSQVQVVSLVFEP